MSDRLRGNTRDSSAPRILALGVTRPLLVVVDAELLTPSPGDRRSMYLAGLLSHDLIHTLRYSEDGPPADQVHRTEFGWPVAEGWLVVEPSDADGWSTHNVYYQGPNSAGTVHSGISGDVGRGNLDRNDQTYAALSPEAAAERRRIDSIALGAAIACNADLLITERPYLLANRWPFARDLTVTAPQQATPLLGLYLRTRREYVAWTAPGGHLHKFNRGLLTWVAARSLLPAGWRWFSSCVAADAADSADLTYLGQSVFQRIERVLLLRDQLFRLMSLPQDNDVADDAMATMDTALLFLMGALDASARVAHRALALSGSERNAGWQRSGWLSTVSDVAPGLAQLVEAETHDGDVLRAISLLRNTVHGAGMPSVRVARGLGQRSDDTAMVLPASETKELAAILDRQGWRSDWGVENFYAGRLYASPDRVVDHLVRRGIQLLDALMRSTPVERLLPPGAPPIEAEPPANPTDALGPRYRGPACWQFGFEEPGLTP